MKFFAIKVFFVFNFATNLNGLPFNDFPDVEQYLTNVEVEEFNAPGYSSGGGFDVYSRGQPGSGFGGIPRGFQGEEFGCNLRHSPRSRFCGIIRSFPEGEFHAHSRNLPRKTFNSGLWSALSGRSPIAGQFSADLLGPSGNEYGGSSGGPFHGGYVSNSGDPFQGGYDSNLKIPSGSLGTNQELW